ncbi:MAG: ABC transporter substrate-binding protein [Cyanobacteria bacterium P01_E01_bin.42]
MNVKSKNYSLSGLFKPIAVALTIALVSCDRGDLTRETTINIGAIVPLTGELAETSGETAINGMQLAIQEVNAKGGLMVDGRSQNAILSIEDDGDDPDTALTAIRQLVYHQEVVAILGLPISRIAIPVANFAETIPIPTISTTSTHPETTAGKNYIFRAGFIDDFQGQIMARFARQELGATRGAILYDAASAYNKGLAETFTREFEKIGGKIVSSQIYTTDRNQDFREQLEQIRALSPDVLFLPNYYHELSQQIQQARELGISAIAIGGDSWDNLNPREYPDAEGSFYSTLWYPNPDNAKAIAFEKAFFRKYGYSPDNGAALAYDAAHLLFEAIRVGERTDPESIRQGLLQIKDFQGVSGTISFQGTGDPLKSATIVRIQDGKPIFYRQIDPQSTSLD